MSHRETQAEFESGQQNIRKRAQAMGQIPIWKLLFRFSGPAILTMVVNAGYTVVDAIFVGRLGSEALGALTVAFPLTLICVALSMGAGVGSASLISRSLGGKDPERANRCASVAISLALLVGVLVGFVYLANLEAMLRLFGARGPVLPLAKQYLSILAGFAFLQSLALVVGNIVRAEGSPAVSGVAMITSALINIILDPILIFGLGPIPRMEVAGAATATVIGQSVGIGIFLFYFLSGRSGYRFTLRNFIPDSRIVAEIYRVGFASTVRMGAMSVAMAIANNLAAAYGTVPLAVLGVVFRLARFAFMPTMGLGQGILPLIGFNHGAKKKDRVGEIVVKAGAIALAWGLLCWLTFMIFASQVISIFNSNPQFINEGTTALRIFVLFFFAVQLQMIASFFFQGIGKGIPSLVLASARQLLFLIPGLLVLEGLFNLNGLWAAFPVADAASILLTLAWIRIEFRRQGIRLALTY
jgi:putative MATE family efflux protein